MKNFIAAASDIVLKAEKNRQMLELINTRPLKTSDMGKMPEEIEIYVIMTGYILGNQKGYFSSSADGAPIYEMTYDAIADRIYFVTYEQTGKQTIDRLEGGNK